MVWFTHPLLERFPRARTATDFGDSLGHLFDFLGERSAPVQGPRVDVWSSEAGLLVRAALPGVAADDLDVQVHRNVLTLSAKRTLPAALEGEEVLQAERWSGEFTRSLELPFAADPEAVQATFHDGLLELRIARPTRDQPRRIAVQTA